MPSRFPLVWTAAVVVYVSSAAVAAITQQLSPGYFVLLAIGAEYLFGQRRP